ncbi:MAG: Crp/Fnr family transcriptional regulator [Solobacterium sp.]|nr:Crp/Fnr family transcriptional regulator [Solobacterium sp.]
MKQFEILKNAPILDGIPEEEFDFLITSLNCQLKNYPKDYIVLKEGTHLKRTGFLIQGALRQYCNHYWDNPIELSTLQPGTLFALSFQVDKEISLVSYQTLCHTVILWFDLEPLFEFKDEKGYHRRLISNLLQAMNEQNQQLLAHRTHLSQPTTREKILSYLSLESLRQQADEFDIPFDRQGLADYLCVERSAMSKELSKLKSDGYLITSKNHFKLLKP